MPSLIPTSVYAAESTKLLNNLPSDLVKQFVVAGHNDLNKLKELLKEEPNLIYARFDWGRGDFEEAIEGAAHVGNKKIINFLIENGARLNLFVLAVLGKEDALLPMLQAYPKLLFAKGAHGFSLLHHAKKGGTEAEGIVKYLKGKGLTKEKFDI